MVSPQRSALTIMGGPMARQRFDLPQSAGEVVIGSDPTCGVCIPLPGVSPRHAALRLQPTGALAIDLGTPRGVFVNDDRVSGEQPLLDGDMLWLGPPTEAESVMLQCRLAPVSAAPADDFFVADPSAGQAPAAPDDVFFVGDTPVPESVAPDETVGLGMPMPALRPAAPPPAVDDEFFVAEPAPVAAPAPPAPDDLFFVEAPPDESVPAPALAPPKVAIPAGPAAGQPPRPPQRVPAPPPAAAPPARPAPSVPPAPAAPVGKPSVPAARPRTTTVVAPQTAGPAPAAGSQALPATAARSGVRPAAARPAPGGTAPVPAGRPRPATAGRGPQTRSAAPGRSARGSSGGSGKWIGLALVAVLLLGGGGAVAALFFVGRPVVASVEPQRARVGDTIVLSGERFADTPAGNIVLFGTHEAQPSGGSAARLEVRIPDLGLTPGQESRVDVRVRVGRKASAGIALMVRESPRVSRLSPDIGLPGEEVLVGGGGWGTTGVGVTFNDVPAPIVDAKPTFVKVRVPPLAVAAGTLVRVVVSQGEDRSAPAAFILGRLPVITAVEPKSASPGDVVTLRGRGFRASAPEHVARIGGALALVTGVNVTGASDGAIQVMVPAEASGGDVPVEVRVRGYENPATALLTVSPAADPVELRFSAEPYVDGGGRLRAAVVTGLGPAFVLSAAGGRTAAQRATEAVARLNAAVAALKAAGESSIELRARGSSSGIALSGAQEALIEVSDEDAAAYQAEAAAQRVKGPVITRGRLATWWAALLGDLVLALGRGERPRQAATLAPEGRALGELFDAATKGGAPGITRAGWAASRPAVRDGVRALAFRVPATVTEPPGRVSAGGPAPGQAGLTPS